MLLLFSSMKSKNIIYAGIIASVVYGSIALSRADVQKINGYYVTKSKHETIFLKDEPVPIMRFLVDDNNDGIVDRKYSEICFPRKGIVRINEPISDKDREDIADITYKLK